jgi:hypothetical protein
MVDTSWIGIVNGRLKAILAGERVSTITITIGIALKACKKIT